MAGRENKGVPDREPPPPPDPVERVTTVICPHCHEKITLPFEVVFAFTCPHCDAGVRVQPPKA